MRRAALIALLLVIAMTNDSHSYDEDLDEREPMKIGGLFDQSDANKKSVEEAVFDLAVQHANERRERRFATFESESKRVTYGEPIEASEALCSLLRQKIIGVIGPSSFDAAYHVRNICDLKDVPLIETRPFGSPSSVVNLHPSLQELGQAYLDIIDYHEWEDFTILYENSTWLPQIEYFLKNYDKKFKITVRELDLTLNHNYRPQLMRAKYESKKILLSCSIEQLPVILTQAQQMGLFNGNHSFIVTSLDMHTIDLQRFQYSRTNITSVRIISPENPLVDEVTRFFADLYVEKNRKRNNRESEEDDSGLEEFSAEKMKLKHALIFDSVLTLTRVMEHNRQIYPEKIFCDSSDSFFLDGMTLFNAIKTVPPFPGLTGEISFNPQGHRGNFELEVLNLNKEGLKKIGVWNSTTGLHIAGYKKRSARSVELRLPTNKTLIVLIANSEPYGMIKSSQVALQGNERFEGYGIELIEKLSEILNFKYEFKLQADNEYGKVIKETSDGTKIWNGMLGELNADRADLAVTDLSVTADREEAFDFTLPFMILGISILYEQPKAKDPDWKSFMEPFGYGVWLCLLAGFIFVSISLYIAGRMSPEEWENPFPCIEEPDELHNQLGIKNCVWFAMGSLFQQGSDIAPKGLSGRIVGSIWWFVTMIIYASYTANLVSFLTVEKPFSLVNSIDDLTNPKPGVRYGAKATGSTLLFFKHSNNTQYNDMYQKMIEDKDLPKDNAAGLKLAKQGKYAFLMESSTIEYTTERHCEVVQVGTPLDEKGYGIAMKKFSPLRDALSTAVLQLQETGELSRMKTKWWKEKHGGGKCDSPKVDETKKLTVHHVSGVFLILFAGCIYGILEGLMRWCLNMRKHSKALGIPFGEVFREEFSFFRQFRRHKKPVNRKSLSSMSKLNMSKMSCNTIEA